MSPLSHCLEALKLSVLAKCSLTSMTPFHAGHVAASVLSFTKYQLSETTILRLYGYLSSKFPPSRFTKDVLAIFCGYANYPAFCELQKQKAG
ncbi:hypothetical protein MTO98_33915 [Mucilaginibacter sp. SMC90]|uniref:hypothetical protein n=1 Tax=Mucilaginibacter sp. SMC90 TaxID=2929803 RepID=UPI001FB28472|nr:hypothetical protein [Mucilaginibacter sp. SMC90]UOE49393.1 hypothetical protein MTO98_33915 [Mucilaginibacter sp. SMC90]